MLTTAAVIALVILFIHATTWEGHIFYRPAEWLRNRLPETIQKPLFDCPVCMSPWYGVILQLLFYWIGIVSNNPLNSLKSFLMTFIVAIIAGGMNVFSIIAIKFYSWLNDEEEFRVEQTIEVNEAIHKKQLELDFLNSIKGL